MRSWGDPADIMGDEPIMTGGVIDRKGMKSLLFFLRLTPASSDAWIDPIRQRPASEAFQEILGRKLGHAIARGEGRTGDVRHHDEIGQPQQWVGWIGWLGIG